MDGSQPPEDMTEPSASSVAEEGALEDLCGLVVPAERLDFPSLGSVPYICAAVSCQLAYALLGKMDSSVARARTPTSFSVSMWVKGRLVDSAAELGRVSIPGDIGR